MMPEFTDEELANLLELETAASDAPWQTGESWAGEGVDAMTAEGHPVALFGEGPGATDEAAFVVELRNAWPRLVAALRAAREDLAVHHADEAAASRVLQAALGDRFSPDGPLADAVGLLVGELEAARAVTTLYAWCGGGMESEREMALFQAWEDYAVKYGTPKKSPEWDQLIADLAARRRARKAEVAARLSEIVTTEEGPDHG